MDVSSAFVIRLVITIGIIWLTQFLTEEVGIKDPPKKWIVIVVAIVMILWMIGVIPVLQLR